MKNLLFALIALMISTTVSAQKKTPGVMTPVDLQHLTVVFPEIDAEYIWNNSEEVEVKELPEKSYESSYVDPNNVIQWKLGGMQKHSLVWRFKKKYNGSYVYYMKSAKNPGEIPTYYRPRQESFPQQYAGNSSQSKQPTQKTPKAPKEPKGNGGGWFEKGAQALEKVAGGRFGQSGSNLGVGNGGLPTVIGERVY